MNSTMHKADGTVTSDRRRTFFILNLLQDVNILRPLIYISARDLRMETTLLITPGFSKRDKSGTWASEINEICLGSGATTLSFASAFDAFRAFSNATGLLVAASESNLQPHKDVHELFKIAPNTLTKITLQHGLECVGFLQSKEQNLAHGDNVTFGADIVCGWAPAPALTSLKPSQRSKLIVTGPTSILQSAPTQVASAKRSMGIVCENMHSLRLRINGDFKTDFLSVFDAFCGALRDREQQVTLRPHPGGQYVLKNNVELPANVTLNNHPIYKIDLSQYAYGISAPSSILVDMVLAGIPTAVWQDEGSSLDLGNYEGLTRISTLHDWLQFDEDARRDPTPFLERQQRFLTRHHLQLSPAIAYERFARILSARNVIGFAATGTFSDAPRKTERILFVANDIIPTLQLSFIKPLKQLVDSGSIVSGFLTEEAMKLDLGKKPNRDQVRDWVGAKFSAFKPSVVIFCRFSAPQAEIIYSHATKYQCATVFHIDDDLLHIPKEIGQKKFEFHSHPSRTGAVRFLLDNVSLVYASTERLKDRLKRLGVQTTVEAGDIYCAADVIRPVAMKPVTKVGYMGIGHEGDLASILPALVIYLRRNPHVVFEFFGSIPVPEALNEFGARITQSPKIDSYELFLTTLADYSWDIGICPLAPLPFNLLKANTKWVEYTAVGIAVIASKNTVYDSVCSGGAGILAESEGEWLEALELLTHDPELRFRQVQLAQAKLRAEYSPARLTTQVVAMIDRAKQLFARVSEIEGESAAVTTVPTQSSRPERIMYVANGYVPTLQLSFVKPLASIVASGDFVAELITGDAIKHTQWRTEGFTSARHWIIDRFAKFKPTVVVFCRYSGPHAQLMLDLSRSNGATCVYHIDDDLLHVPTDIGTKSEYHNKPERLASARLLLDSVDLVYCSTTRLEARLTELGISTPKIAGKIYCSGTVIAASQLRPVRKVGYMASADHAHNLNMVLPAIVQLLDRNPEVTFELFGSIPVPEALIAFGARITQAPKIDNYEEFLQRFSEYGWDIGICPLTPIAFNMMKANTKWVEYTSIGAAVVAQRGTVYDECCADGCGLLAETPEQWLVALESLVRDPEARHQQVVRAQQKLVMHYSVEKLREQVLTVIDSARTVSTQQNAGSSSRD